jgi:hypothetical protein
MSDIRFEEEGSLSFRQAEQKPLLIRLVLATRVVASDRHAEYVLLGFAVVVILISLFLFSHSGPAEQKPTSTSVEQMKQFMRTTPAIQQ